MTRTIVPALRVTAFTALVAIAAAAPARAEEITRDITYSTIGSVGTAGLTGLPAVGISNVSSTSMTAPGTFNLGSFQIAKLGGNATSTYNNTPFTINFYSGDVDPIILDGTISGQISGNGTSSLVAKFSLLEPIKRDFPDFISKLNLGQTSYNLASNSTVAVQGSIALSAVPEPGTIAVFLAGFAGLGLMARRRIRQS